MFLLVIHKKYEDIRGYAYINNINNSSYNKQITLKCYALQFL